MKYRLCAVLLCCVLILTGCASGQSGVPQSGEELYADTMRKAAGIAEKQDDEASEADGSGEMPDDPDENLNVLPDDLTESIRENHGSGGHLSAADPAPQETALPEHTGEASGTAPAEAEEAPQPEYDDMGGYAAVTGFSHVPADPAAVLTVPAELGGLPVTAVGRYGFYGVSCANQVQLPETVTVLEDYAFNGSGIRTFSYVPETELTAGAHVLADCAALETVRFADRSYTFGDYCFEHSGIVSMAGEDTVLTLGNDCFSSLDRLETLTFRGELTTGEACFGRCAALSEVTLSSSTLALGNRSFRNSGVRTLSATDCTGTIGAECFSDCERLRLVKLGEGITALGDYAFAGCRILRTVELPASLTEIAAGCFADCPELTIYAPAGSAAYQYAEQNGIPVKAV